MLTLVKGQVQLHEHNGLAAAAELETIESELSVRDCLAFRALAELHLAAEMERLARNSPEEEDGDDDYYEIGGMNSEQINAELPKELDEMFGISEQVEEYESEEADDE